MKTFENFDKRRVEEGENGSKGELGIGKGRKEKGELEKFVIRGGGKYKPSSLLVENSNNSENRFEQIYIFIYIYTPPQNSIKKCLKEYR